MGALTAPKEIAVIREIQRQVVTVTERGPTTAGLDAALSGYVKGNGAGVFTAVPTIPQSDVVLANDLAAVEALATTGIAVRTATSTWATRTLVAPAAGISVANGDGVAGNPTLALANDLGALEALAATGIAVRSAADTWVQRAVNGTANRVTVTNGDGVAGDPVIDIAATYVGQSSITTLGTITTGTWAASFPVAGGVNSTGEVGIRIAPGTSYSLRVAAPSGGGNSPNAILVDATAPSTATVVLYGNYSLLRTAAEVFTIGTVAHFSAASVVKGAGSTITSVWGFAARNTIAVGTNNYGFYSDIAAAANTYQLYMGGTADSLIVGSVGVGMGITGTQNKFSVRGSLLTNASSSIVYLDAAVPSSVTTALYGVKSADLGTSAAAFTLSAVYHYAASVTTKGAGSTISNVYGFHASNAIAVGTSNYGFASTINAAANTYQLYMTGTALNFLKGGTILDTTAAPTVGANQVGLGATVATTVGAAGAASALPATPDGYWIINVAGTQKKVPYYAT